MSLTSPYLLLTALCVLGSTVQAAESLSDVGPLRQRLSAIEQQLKGLPELIPHAQSQQRLGFHGLEASPAWIMLDFGKRVTPEKVVLFPARLPALHGAPSAGLPASLEIELSDTPDFSESIRLADWREPAPGAGEELPFLSFHGNRATGRYLRVLVTGFRTDPFQSGSGYFRLGEIVVLEHGQNAALNCPVTSTASVDNARAWEAYNLTDGYLWCLPLRGREISPSNGHHGDTATQPYVDGNTWVEVDLGTAQPIDEIHLVPAHPKGTADLPGYGFPSHFLVLADAGSADEKLIRNETKRPYPPLSDKTRLLPNPLAILPNPGATQMMMATPGLVARRVRVSCDVLWRRGPISQQRPEEYLLALGELQCWHAGKNVAAGRSVLASGIAKTDASWSPAALTDGYSSRHELLDWTTWLAGIEQAETLHTEARALRHQIQRQGELRARHTASAAIAAAVAIGCVAVLAVVLQRRGARLQQDRLRTRIARDLHDEIGASLSHLAMQGDLARQQLQRSELTSERLEGISASARETLDQMRDIIWLLAHKEGNWQELSQRLEAIARRLLEGIEHQITLSGKPPEGRPAIEYTRDILAFLKETLTNVRKHSQATRVHVLVDWSGPLLITVEDNGKGFDIEEVQNQGGSGLQNLRMRAAAMNATFEIHSTLEEGTRLRIAAPFTEK